MSEIHVVVDIPQVMIDAILRICQNRYANGRTPPRFSSSLTNSIDPRSTDPHSSPSLPSLIYKTSPPPSLSFPPHTISLHPKYPENPLHSSYHSPSSVAENSTAATLLPSSLVETWRWEKKDDACGRDGSRLVGLGRSWHLGEVIWWLWRESG